MTSSLERTRAFSVSFAQAASLTGIPLCKRILLHNVFDVAGAVVVVVGLVVIVDCSGGWSLSCGCEALWWWLSLLALTIRPLSRVGPRFFLFLLRLALVLDPARGLDFLKSPGDVAPPIGLLGDFVSIANDGTV